jgi:hypothetical protein
MLTIGPEDDATRVFETLMNYYVLASAVHILKLERYREDLMNYQMERHHIPDYSTVDSHCCENLISNNITIDLPTLFPPSKQWAVEVDISVGVEQTVFC